VHGAWLKVPLGKLGTERMVPLDEETLDVVDRIVARRTPGRALPHPRTGRPTEFLLVHQGRRVSAQALRDELARTAEATDLGKITPHALRHTYATALVNAGVSLQALMQLLGHVSAAMSLRYGRLFDTTVREEYERALTQAKAAIAAAPSSGGPTMGSSGGSTTRPSWDGPSVAGAPLPLADITRGDWRDTATIKSRLAGGFCLRAPAQGSCAYANICEHCPNFRTDAGFLAVLGAQRADAAVNRPGFGRGSELTGRVESCQQRGSIPMSCVSGRFGWCSTSRRRPAASAGRVGGSASSWASTRTHCAAG